jgi:hypothetical protein
MPHRVPEGAQQQETGAARGQRHQQPAQLDGGAGAAR